MTNTEPTKGIRSVDLIDMLKNCVLFTKDKSNVGFVIQLSVTATAVVGVASDDNFVIRHRTPDLITPMDAIGGAPIYLSVKEAKAWVGRLLAAEETIEDTTVPWDSFPDGVDCPNPELWEMIPELADFDNLSIEGVVDSLEIWPERFAKFSRLSGDSRWPVSLYTGWSDALDKSVLYWRYGPRTQGVVSPVLTSVVREELGDLFERSTFHLSGG